MPEFSVASASVPAVPREEELYPIREVSRLTGVNPVTLRAWERRYGLIQPTRTDSGHRLYSLADIDAVRSILAWIERGVAVSKVGKILARSNTAKAPSAPAYDDVAVGEWGEWQAQLRRAVAAFDEVGLERLYGQVFSSYPLAVVFQDVLLPVWQELLLRQDGFGQTSEWLFLDTFLRGRALQRLQLSRGQSEERVLLAALPGHGHELELLVTGLLLAGSDLAVSLLGIGQPFDELPLVCEKIQPQALVLFSNRPPETELPRQLGRLVLALDCPLALAGEVAELAEESLQGTPIACLGSEGRLMPRRLRQFLAGHLDT
ncbi:DNA-binding transcriptional regulator, MerR family [Geopseudomonas sagittaria]|uniref:DNA-binding transcriptional regulator, MerR family n=1 Tax=Geopseudomonas sagittaria TaxID=1135990 RepID=A0A1I5V009_9GAMM|nr:MerR family transcriptional regulator [Pseudomonas sagittaria]MCM2330248.1 MerR family transcriptional regulator [Pseudomonas sagittaria]SFQ00752.1 DNA-binding transcriptional regulator, MerR family [Pseudomonas sagittaria]